MLWFPTPPEWEERMGQDAPESRDQRVAHGVADLLLRTHSMWLASDATAEALRGARDAFAVCLVLLVEPDAEDGLSRCARMLEELSRGLSDVDRLVEVARGRA